MFCFTKTDTFILLSYTKWVLQEGTFNYILCSHSGSLVCSRWDCQSQSGRGFVSHDVVLLASSNDDLQLDCSLKCEASRMRVRTSKCEATALSRERGGAHSRLGMSHCSLGTRQTAVTVVTDLLADLHSYPIKLDHDAFWTPPRLRCPGADLRPASPQLSWSRWLRIERSEHLCCT